MSTSTSAIILGTGSYLPEKILTNFDLSAMVDTTDQWIVERTGIRQRHIAAEGEFTSDLATEAAKRAIESAGIELKEIGLIIVATTTPDQIFPSVATKVQANLGIKEAAAFDLQAVCSGFIYALSVANNFIRTGQIRTALVIGAETMSRLVDWKDRTTCVLFGDGAGAVVLQAHQIEKRGIVATELHSDGSYQDILYVDGGVSTGSIGKLRMVGKDVFKHAVEKMTSCVQSALIHQGLTIHDVDYLVPHQANQRILAAVAERLGLSHDRVIMTVDRHANTSAASIPLALDDAVQKKMFKQGDVIVMEALGGGLSWGACIYRW